MGDLISSSYFSAPHFVQIKYDAMNGIKIVHPILACFIIFEPLGIIYFGKIVTHNGTSSTSGRYAQSFQNK